MPISYKVVFAAAVIGIVPVAVWIWLVRNYFFRTRRNMNFVLNAFFAGVLTAIPASLLEIFVIETNRDSAMTNFFEQIAFPNLPIFWMASFVPVLIMAFIEEISKGAGLAVIAAKDRIVSRSDGLSYGIIVGVAFAVTENGIYFAGAFNSQPFWDFATIVLLRFLLSTSAHVAYSGLMGVYLAETLLENKIAAKIKGIIKTILLPVGIHTVFNSLLATPYSWVNIIIIAFSMFIMWKAYNLDKHSNSLPGRQIS